MNESFHRQKPGKPIRARTLARPAAALDGLQRVRPGGGLAQSRVCGIPLPYATPQPATGFWAQTAGLAGGSDGTRYGFTSVAFNNDGTVSPDGNLTANATDPSGWAREILGSTTVPPNSLVYLTPAEVGTGQQDFYLFTYELGFLAVTKLLSAYPTTANAWFACESVFLAGPPSEAGTPTLIPQTNTFFAYNAGTRLPPQGQQILVARAQGIVGTNLPACYFFFRWDG